MPNSSGHQSLELGAVVVQVRLWMLGLAVLNTVRMLVLPLSAYSINTHLPLYAPLALGLILEPVRSAVAMGCRRRVRHIAMVGFAAEALNADKLHRQGSATRAAHIMERMVSSDIPGGLAALLSVLVLLVLSASRLGAAVVVAVLALLVCVAVTGLFWQGRRRPLHHLLVDALINVNAWMSVASVDQGEVCTDTARRFYFRRVGHASDEWSRAESRLERSRLLIRAGLGTVVLVLGLALLIHGDLLDFLRSLPQLRNRPIEGVVDLIVLASVLPSILTAARYWDALSGGRSEITALRPSTRVQSNRVSCLGSKPQQLQVRALEVRYESELGVSIDELSVDLARPLILVGTNGSGKSTLLAAMAGCFDAAAGSVRIDGIDATQLDRSQVAIVPQDPVLVEQLSVLDNAQLVVPTVTPMELSQYLSALGLSCSVDDALGSLSRGERRRVAIARALLKYPRLLLLDEPDAWLDAEGRRRLLDALSLILPDTAIVIATHRLEMAQFGGTVAVLGSHQKLEASGTLDYLQEHSPTLRTVIGS